MGQKVKIIQSGKYNVEKAHQDISISTHLVEVRRFFLFQNFDFFHRWSKLMKFFLQKNNFKIEILVLKVFSCTLILPKTYFKPIWHGRRYLAIRFSVCVCVEGRGSQYDPLFISLAKYVLTRFQL